MIHEYEVLRLDDNWNWESVEGLPSLSTEDIFCMVDENEEKVPDDRGHTAWMVVSKDFDEDGEIFVNAQPVVAMG